MKKKTFQFLGCEIELISYNYGAFLYPSFNGNAEFKCTKQGFKQLSSYIRTVKWMENLMAKTF